MIAKKTIEALIATWLIYIAGVFCFNISGFITVALASIFLLVSYYAVCKDVEFWKDRMLCNVHKSQKALVAGENESTRVLSVFVRRDQADIQDYTKLSFLNKFRFAKRRKNEQK